MPVLTTDAQLYMQPALQLMSLIFPQIWDMNPSAQMEEAVVVFWFHSVKDARTFFVSDCRMKQPDFPAPAGHCEAWAVVRFYTPPNEHGQ